MDLRHLEERRVDRIHLRYLGLPELVEHQQIGSRHAVHTLEATTYPDRLRIADLVDGAAQGHVQELSAEEYERRRVDMASTPRIG